MLPAYNFGTMDHTTQPYPNGAIPFIRPPRRNRQKRELKWNQAADDAQQRRIATGKLEEAHRYWRSLGTKRLEVEEPTIDDFLPDHLKGSVPREQTGLPTVSHPLANDEDDEDFAPPMPPASPVLDDDADYAPPVPQGPTAAKKAPKKAAKPAAIDEDDDTVPDTTIP